MGGLFDGLEALEGLHRNADFESIRAGLEEDPSRSWRTLVEKYSKFVYSVAFQAAAGLNDPEEFASEIYRRVFVRLEASNFALIRNFQGKCDFRTYLYRMVKTERFRLFRRKGVEQRAGDTMLREARSEEPAAPSTSWSHGVGRRVVEKALGNLDEEDRRLLVLRFAGGLKLRELADAGVARDTNDAAYRLRKALARLDALPRARAGPDWDEHAFREALETFRRRLFPEENAHKTQIEVSDRDDPVDGGAA